MLDIVTGADTLEYYANMVGGGGLNGETVTLREGEEGSAWVYTRKEALGVCVGIGAWNYPIQMYVRTGVYLSVCCMQLSCPFEQSILVFKLRC